MKYQQDPIYWHTMGWLDLCLPMQYTINDQKWMDEADIWRSFYDFTTPGDFGAFGMGLGWFEESGHDWGYDAPGCVNKVKYGRTIDCQGEAIFRIGEPGIDDWVLIDALSVDGEDNDWDAPWESYIDSCLLSGPAGPNAEFLGNPTNGNAPLTVNFTDLSSGSPTSWDWTFGDGGTSQAQHPSHDYTSVNSYTVGLTAYNAQGQDTETKVDYITVSNQSCHVGAIDMADAGNPKYRAEATITVHDQDHLALSGVTVDITWSDAASDTDSGVTDEYGQVVFISPKNRNGGTFTCCVDSLTKDGYPYSSSDNHETCDNITLP
jgi:PKD repeat protein